MAERLGNRATKQKVAGLISSSAKLSCVPGQGTSPYIHPHCLGGLSLYLLYVALDKSVC